MSVHQAPLQVERLSRMSRPASTLEDTSVLPDHELTFHETLFDNLAETLHVSFWQVLALLCLFQPLVGPRTFGQTCGPGLRYIAVFCHGSRRDTMDNWKGSRVRFLGGLA